ncbi:MAG: apolipoprotein N-acyltransferase, partial [Paracoccaceae bacterium]
MTEPDPQWVARLGLTGRWRGRALALLAGAGIGLGQAPFSLIWLALPALSVAMFWGMTSSGARQAAVRGWQVGFAAGLVALSWIVEPFLVDVASDGWMAPFALLVMAAGFGAFWGAAFWAAA